MSASVPDGRSEGQLLFGGLLIPSSGWSATRRWATELEAADFDLVAVDDHMSNPISPTGSWGEAWTTLAGIAEVTSSIRIGPLVSNTILRHPSLLARQALTVDEMSAGRVELGLGAGYAPTDHAAVEYPELVTAERRERFAESVATIHALVHGEPAPPGRWFDLSGLSLRQFDESKELPITVAAHDRSSLDVAARWADRWVSFGGWGMTTEQILALTAERIQILEERCAARGRVGLVGRALLLGSAAVNRDPLWTSATAFEDTVARFCEIGIDTFVLYWPPSSVSRDVDPEVVATVIGDVIPRLRRTGPPTS